MGVLLFLSFARCWPDLALWGLHLFALGALRLLSRSFYCLLLSILGKESWILPLRMSACIEALEWRGASRYLMGLQSTPGLWLSEAFGGRGGPTKTRHKRRSASTMLANRASLESKHGGRLDHLMSLASKH